MQEFAIIQVEWSGPFAVEEALEFRDGRSDRGIYQIYGTHEVLGPNTLLYIGQADSNTFGDRLSAHLEWFQWEAFLPTIFLGRICRASASLSNREWERTIDNAERILIFQCSPPYNSSGLKTLRLSDALLE